MNELNPDEFHPQTLAIRAGQLRTNENAHSEPIFATSSFVFDSAEQAAQRFSGAEPGNVYSRFTNPTVKAFEQRLAILEKGERAVATASGMAAILSVALGLLSAGDHIVASRSLFGTTHVLFDKYLAKFGIQTSYVALTDLAGWQAAIKSNTKLFFIETPSNPLNEVADIKALADIAHSKNVLLAVDNCLCTPALQQPLTLGADLVVHSATKYIDGQGRSIGGAVVGSNTLLELIYGVVRTCGPCMSPFNAWIALKGLETLSLRMQAHSAQALQLAFWLQEQAAVGKVYYAGLPAHPQHALAAAQQNNLFSGVLSFELKEGKAAAWRWINATKLFSITANLGDVKSTVTHPATTTHGRLTPEEKQAAGISEGLIRLSVGLENLDDLKADCLRGFAAI